MQNEMQGSSASNLQAPGVLKTVKNGKPKGAKGANARLHRSLSPAAMSGPGTHAQTPKQRPKKRSDAAATAAAIKDRNHAAIKTHVSTRGANKSRCTSSFRDEATTDRIARWVFKGHGHHYAGYRTRPPLTTYNIKRPESTCCSPKLFNPSWYSQSSLHVWCYYAI